MVRNLPAAPITERARLWRDSLATAPGIPLRQLYVGETWTQVRRLEATAELAGFRADPPRRLCWARPRGGRCLSPGVRSHVHPWPAGLSRRQLHTDSGMVAGPVRRIGLCA